MRVGIGYDVHKLVKTRKLILGGVEIEYEYGLLGHSDADVLIHAIMDALLGAAGLGDIGKHFPDTDNKYKDISSIKLLLIVKEKLEIKGYTINNMDCIIVAQMPKISPYITLMEKNIADTLDIDKDRVNIKATTTEKLGFEGRKEGISAQVIVSLNECKK
jgi:2-C-methyl-D-erythritol 2,4-cyclodiphosphate synthase